MDADKPTGSAVEQYTLARTGFLLAAISIALAAGVYLARPEPFGLQGDEPHYLVMADSIVHDGTLDLRNAYARNKDDSHIFHGLTPHVRIVRHRWAPFHGVGLAIVLAGPYWLGGIVGAKLMLCLSASMLTLALYWFLARRLPIEPAAWMTLGLVVCLPFLFGASQIYPDLVGGTLAISLAVWLIHAGERPGTAAGWSLFWLAAGLFPWLNSKYLASTAILVLWGLGIRWRDRRQGRRPSRLEADAIWLVLVGVVSLALFHLWGVGTPLGPRRLREIASPFSRAAMIFLGLHFDQSQGMFLQHPLLLGGLAALPVFAWRRPLDAIGWSALYASLIVPNSLELARWGGGGPVGRFAWSAEWLWAIPIGVAIAEFPAALLRLVRPAVFVSLAYQVLLGLRWLGNQPLLFPHFDENLALRDSLFPVSLRPFVPSFYLWDFSSYRTYPPNVEAYVLAAALVAIGTVSVLGHARTHRSS